MNTMIILPYFVKTYTLYIATAIECLYPCDTTTRIASWFSRHPRGNGRDEYGNNVTGCESSTVH